MAARGAYGFRLAYRDENESLNGLVEVGDDLPLVEVAWRLACPTADVEDVSADEVTYGARGGSMFRIRRDPPSVLFDLPEPPAPGALIHPLLTVGISVLARWRGDATIHAGAFETEHGAWGVFGAREGGKSAMLAAIARRGIPIVSDDLLTIRDRWVWSGPSCVDLRPDTADRYTEARYLGIVGRRPRYRLDTPPASARSPLRGFFVLGWHEGPGIQIRPLRMQERLEWVYRQEYIPLVGYSNPDQLVPLLGLPAWHLTRPREWEVTDEVLNRILDITENGSAVE